LRHLSLGLVQFGTVNVDLRHGDVFLVERGEVVPVGVVHPLLGDDALLLHLLVALQGGKVHGQVGGGGIDFVMLNAGRGAFDVGLGCLQGGALGIDFSRNLLPVELGQQLALVDVLIDIHVEVLHNPAGFGLEFDLGNRLHFSCSDDALIDLPAGDLVQPAGIEMRAGPAHAHYHQAHNHGDSEQAAPDPNAFTFSLRRHNTPNRCLMSCNTHPGRGRFHDTSMGLPLDGAQVSSSITRFRREMIELMLFRMVSVALLILANGFFVAAEFALVSVRETRIERLITLGRPGARAVRRLQENMEDFLPAVQLGVTLCSLALGWIGEPAVATLFEHWFQGMPHARVYAHLLAVPIAFALITYLHVLLGELVPKSLALRKAEVLAVAVAGPMDVFIRVTRPVVRLMKWSARVVMRLFGMEMMQGGEVHSPEELKLIATASRRMGMLPAFQERLIHRAVELNSVPTREIMTPRQRIFSLPQDMLIEDANARVVEEQHSRVPVYDPAHGPEHIVGVVYSKDLSRLMHFRMTAQTRFARAPFTELRLGQVMHDVLVVPETKPVLDLLSEFQQMRRHIAIVVDEYGSTVGLATVEDAIEQIIGEVEDEFDIGPRAAVHTTSGAVVLDGGVNLRDLETQMNWHLPRNGGVETLAGFLLTRLGKIPTGEETVDFEGRRFTVVEMNDHRISQVRVERLEHSAEDAIEGRKNGAAKAVKSEG
jgi:putative hemolysin